MGSVPPGYKMVKKGEWYQDVRTGTLRKWTKDKPLLVMKTRDTDISKPTKEEWEPM